MDNTPGDGNSFSADPLESLQRSLEPLVGLRAILLKGRGGKREGERREEGEERNGRDRPPFRKVLDPP